MAATDSVVVQVSVADSASPAVESLSTPLIAAYHTKYSARFKLYDAAGGAGLAQMVTDGFATSDAAYKAASAICSQNPSPANFAVGRRALAPQQTLELTCNDATVGDAYSFTVVSGTTGAAHAIAYTIAPDYGTAVSGTADVTNGSDAVTFSSSQTMAEGDLLVFASQPGVWYALAAAVSSTAATLTGDYLGTTAAATTATHVAALAGTFHVEQGSATVATTTSQVDAVSVGDSVMFVEQLGVYYEVESVSADDLTLTTPYSGTTASATYGADVSTVTAAAAAVEALLADLTDIGTVSLDGATITIARTDGALNDVQGWRTNGFANVEIEDVTVDPGIATDLAAIAAADSLDWYGLVLDSNSAAEVKAAAAWAEATGQGGKVFFANTSDWGSGQQDVTSDVFSALQASRYMKTHVQQNNQQLLCYAGASTAAWTGAQNPGSYAMAQAMTLPGVPADTEVTLPEGEALVINAYTASSPTTLGKGGNFYKVTAGLNMSFWGFTPSGRGMPLTIFIDWLQANMQADVLGVLAGLPRVPMTDFGLGLIGDAIDNRLNIGASSAYGGIDPTEPIVVTVPSAASISPEDRAVFNASGFAWEATYVSSIESVVVKGTLIN